MRLILSTSNIIGESPSIWRSYSSKSNTELISSLRTHFSHSASHAVKNDNSEADSQPAYLSWTNKSGESFEIPKLDFTKPALQEEREQYDITAKLFYLPGASVTERAEQTRKALAMVLKELDMPSLDLLIVSFPGIYFDEEEDCPEKISTRGPVESEPEDLGSILKTWQILESLKDEGLVDKLGIAEFGRDRLNMLLESARILPKVNQINLRNCCSVPKDLMALAKSRSVDLLVHNDSSNILPRGTLRELLGPLPNGAGILGDGPKTGDKRKSLHGETSQKDASGEVLEGDLQPQWVIKYTAVVRNRGVVEYKGYLAVAELEG